MHQLIDRWLHERQQLVQAFDALSGIQAPAPNAEELQHFCQLLLDYVSAGHFEVYEQLTAEGRPSAISVAWSWPSRSSPAGSHHRIRAELQRSLRQRRLP